MGYQYDAGVRAPFLPLPFEVINPAYAPVDAKKPPQLVTIFRSGTKIFE